MEGRRKASMGLLHCPNKHYPIFKKKQKRMEEKKQKQKQKKKKKKKKRGEPFLKAIFCYLTSDSYMYGPLLSPYPSKSRPASKLPPAGPANGTGILSLSSPLCAMESDPSMVTTTTARPSELTTEEAKRIIHFSRISKEYSWERQTSDLRAYESRLQDGRAQNLDLPLHENMLQDGKKAGDFEFKETPVKMAVSRDLPTYSATESYSTDEEFAPLGNDMAEEVIRRLVRRLGGRYSKELGIYVDTCNCEVERWFLAASLMTSPHSFEQCKQMFKKLQEKGVTKPIHVLGMDQNEIAEVIDEVGLTIHKFRIASRLLRLAEVLRERYNGHICSLKHISSYSELKHQLQLLPGVSSSASHTFLRELRGVWPGANPDLDRRTKHAAKHLHLVPDVRSDVQLAINKLSQAAGLDSRDVELAVSKLGLRHAHQYPCCLGGSECAFLGTAMSDTSF